MYLYICVYIIYVYVYIYIHIRDSRTPFEDPYEPTSKKVDTAVLDTAMTSCL